MSKQIRLYTVITSLGQWGKGHTPEEAATNAGIQPGNEPQCQSKLFYADQNLIVGEVDVNDFGGAQVTPKTAVNQDELRAIYNQLRIKVGVLTFDKSKKLL